MLQVKTAEVSTCVDLYRIIYTCTIGLNIFFFLSNHIHSFLGKTNTFLSGIRKGDRVNDISSYRDVNLLANNSICIVVSDVRFMEQ